MNTICTHQVPTLSIPNKPEKRLESMVRKALYEFKLIENPSFALALSGGKDSLTLLSLLKSISGKGFPDFTIHAIHVTGKFSCGPMMTLDYLKSACAAMEVPLSIVESNYSPRSFIAIVAQERDAASYFPRPQSLD